MLLPVRPPELRGAIKDALGRPIANAEVQLEDARFEFCPSGSL